MRYLSLCSGIEAASVGFPSDWEPIAFSEIDPFPSAVLKHRFPDVPNWGDMTKFSEWPYVPIDLICGGTPCQSFSVAGLRKGLDDARGNLMLTFGHILGKYRPTWFVWENVPGVLSSDEGRDFASFLGLVTGQLVEPPEDGWRTAGAISGIDSAYGIAWRVLDAQYTRSPNHPRAVPQRRRRVFVVGHLGDWRRAAAVLLDSESLSRDPSPRRETRERVAGIVESGVGVGCESGGGVMFDVAPAITAGGVGYNRAGNGRGQDPVIAVYENHAQDSRVKELDSVCTTIHAKYGMGGGNIPLVAHSLSAEGFDASEDGTGRGTPIVPVVGPLTRASNVGGTMTQQDIDAGHVIAVQGTIIGRSENAGPQGSGANDDGAMFTLTKTDQHAVAIRTAQTSANGHGIAEDVAHTLDGVQGQAVAFQSKASAHQSMNPSNVSPSLDVGKSDGVAVAITMRQREGKPGGGKGPLVFEEHSGTLATNNDQTLLTPAMAVRRLLPVECERLQGFPEIEKTVIIEVCLGLLKSYASAVIPNRKLLKSVGIAEKTDLQESAPSAHPSSLTNDPPTNKPALPDVLINCEDNGVEMRNSLGQRWFVSSAEYGDWYPHHLPIDAFVQVIVGLCSIAGQTTSPGEVDFPQNARFLTDQKSGNLLVSLFGNEITPLVVDALTDLTTLKELSRYTTSGRSNAPTTAQILEILSWCVALATSGYIPATTPIKSFLTIQVRHSVGWTNVPYRNKPNSPDGPRYKAIGNSMATNCMEWIGLRIKAIDSTAGLSE